LARPALKVYVNASAGDPADQQDDALYVPVNPPQPLRMGAGQSEPGVVGRFYEGRLDEVALYNGALSNAQIQSHYKKSFS